MSVNALAVFAVKAPVEPTAPTQDQANDNGFKDFMDTAVHKVDTAQKPSKENSPQNQNDTRAEKTHPKAKTRSEERRGGKECRSRWSPKHEKKKKQIHQ